MGKKVEAQQHILQLLHRCGEITVGDAVAALNSSEATIRRHFAEMEERGELIRIYGGVRLPVAAGISEYLYQLRSVTNLREKRAIGNAAAALINDSDRLFFDSGTTVSECGNALSLRLERKELTDISVVTNSLIYSEKLASCCPVSLIGGHIRTHRMDTAGTGALLGIERFNFTRAVLGADALSEDGTLSTTDEDTSLLAAAALRRSREVLILVDSSKIGTSSFVDYGKLSGANYTLVTDSGADRELLKKWRSTGTRIIITDTKQPL